MTEPSKQAREVLKRATAVWEDNYAVNNATEAALIIQQYGDQRVAEAEARIVGWLYKRADDDPDYAVDRALHEAADAIERREHTTAQSAKEIG